MNACEIAELGSLINAINGRESTLLRRTEVRTRPRVPGTARGRTNGIPFRGLRNNAAGVPSLSDAGIETATHLSKQDWKTACLSPSSVALVERNRKVRTFLASRPRNDSDPAISSSFNNNDVDLDAFSPNPRLWSAALIMSNDDSMDDIVEFP